MTPRKPKPRKPTKRQTMMALQFKFGKSVWDLMCHFDTYEDEVEDALRAVLNWERRNED